MHHVTIEKSQSRNQLCLNRVYMYRESHDSVAIFCRDIILFLLQFLSDTIELQVEKECSHFQYYIFNLQPESPGRINQKYRSCNVQVISSINNLQVDESASSKSE